MDESAAVSIARDLMKLRVAAQCELLRASRVDSPPTEEWIRRTLDRDFSWSSDREVVVQAVVLHASSRPVRPHWDVLFLVHDERHEYGEIGLAMLAVRVDEETGDAMLSNTRRDWLPLAMPS